MKYFVTLISLFLSTPILAQRYDNTRTYDIIGLADGDEIMDALAIGIPLIIVGFLIAWFTMWGKSEEEKQKDSGNNIGCIGVLIIIIGLFALLPLLTWIEAIITSIVSIGIIIGLICLIFMWIKEKF